MKFEMRFCRRTLVLIAGLSYLLMPINILAQGTRVDPPKNSYSLAQDVQLGQQTAVEIRRQLPILPEESDVDNYVERVGRRLQAAIPERLRYPDFRYSFDVVNARDINAFALPGGPMFVNRGMIEAARNEGEMAGVMAHELSHVVLRHGTAQASKQQSAKYQLPALGGAILGAIIGGNLGGIIAQGSQMGVGAFLLKYSREFETQADVLGAQIMARAGYDPRDLANMFRTIESESGGSGGPEWLSSHPNPGNRYERIEREAGLLRVSPGEGRDDSVAFNRAQSELRRMPPTQTMNEILQRTSEQQGARSYPQDSQIEQRVELPSTSYRSYTAGDQFRISVPTNWQEFGSQNSVTFAPRGAYGTQQGQSVFTHGAIAGLASGVSNSLEQSTDRYIGALLQNNSYLQPQGRTRRSNIGGRSGLSITLAGRSPVTGRNEIVNVSTALLRNGQLFYLINVAPQEDYRSYERAFNDMLRSVQLN